MEYEYQKTRFLKYGKDFGKPMILGLEMNIVLVCDFI